MEAWVSSEEITSRLGYKILLAGLSEAGKTAVKRIFFLKQKTEDVTNLAATINYERMSISIKDIPVTILDLGGQKIFLRRFLSSFSPFVFSKVKSFIFLIDVANKTSTNNSIQYFSACLEKLAQHSPDTEIFVFLHKNDLVINLPNSENIHAQLKERFQLNCATKLKFFRTTIYRPGTIIDAFGRIFELAMPQIAWSEFVEERTIGEIEEYHETYITLREPVSEEGVIEPQLEAIPTSTISSEVRSPTFSTSLRKIGDEASLEKLQRLISEAAKKQEKITIQESQTAPFLSSAASEESDKETILSHVEVTPRSEKNLFQEATDSSSSVLQPSASPEEIKSLEIVKDLVEFYRIDQDEAANIVHSGYKRVFEVAAASGIKIPLIMNVLFKYIPFIESKGLKTESLTSSRLLELFSGFLKGLFKEDDILKILVFSVEKSNMTIAQIVDKYLDSTKSIISPPRKKKRKVRVKQEPYEVVKLKIPIEVKNLGGVITLPDTSGLGLKIDIVGQNAQMSFFYRGRSIGSPMVSTTISTNEIIYLLTYEMNMVSLGYFEKEMVTLNFAASVIHEVLHCLQKNNLQSTKEITEPSGERKNTIQFSIPMEIQLIRIVPEGEYFLLPEGEGVAFTIIKDEQGYLLKFTRFGFPVGQIIMIKAVSADFVTRILREEIQLPIESNAVVKMAGRIVHAGLITMIKALETVSSEPYLDTTPVIKMSEEKTEKFSKELEFYLDKLLDD